MSSLSSDFSDKCGQFSAFCLESTFNAACIKVLRAYSSC